MKIKEKVLKEIGWKELAIWLFGIMLGATWILSWWRLF